MLGQGGRRTDFGPGCIASGGKVRASRDTVSALLLLLWQLHFLEPANGKESLLGERRAGKWEYRYEKELVAFNRHSSEADYAVLED